MKDRGHHGPDRRGARLHPTSSLVRHFIRYFMTVVAVRSAFVHEGSLGPGIPCELEEVAESALGHDPDVCIDQFLTQPVHVKLYR